MLAATLAPAQDSIEPSKCAECPFFIQSTRSPSCGFCKLYSEAVLGQDKPGDLCVTEFWNLVNSPKPTHEYQAKMTVVHSSGKRGSTAVLTRKGGETFVVSID